MIESLLKRVRRNHALEHATVALLLEKGVRPPLGGYSTSHGFFIFGKMSLDLLDETVHEALTRLREGNHELAISPYCGTNLATGAILSGIIWAAILGKRRKGSVRTAGAIAAVMGAILLSRPLGSVIQRRFTTLSHVDDLEIGELRRVECGPLTVHRVSTQVGQ